MKKNAVMVILRNENSFLLLRRSKEPNKGKFAPVGGKLETHETPRQAAFRETLEETGIKLEKVKFCGVLSEASTEDYNWICYIYLADIERVEPPPCDEGELQWVDYQDVRHLPVPPTDPCVYDYVLRGQPFVFDAVFDADLNLVSMFEEIEGKPMLFSASAF